ncbi:MAG: lipoprotein [Gammaproteobacteria bacterium]|nr:lipoprotein [Gammaproteobacteria bacterium]
MTHQRVPRPRTRLTFRALLVSVLVLAGCGQKGALYLPDRDPNAQSTSK